MRSKATESDNNPRRRHALTTVRRADRCRMPARLNNLTEPRRLSPSRALLTVVLGVFGTPVAKSLSAREFQDPTSESARSTQILTDKFDRGRRAIADRGIDTPRRRQRPSSGGGQRHCRPASQFATHGAGDITVDRAAGRGRGSGQPRPHVRPDRGGHRRRREPAAEVRQGIVRPGGRRPRRGHRAVG
jgi:hypothetical protein